MFANVLVPGSWPAADPGTPLPIKMHDLAYMSQNWPGRGRNSSRLELYYLYNTLTGRHDIPGVIFSTPHLYVPHLKHMTDMHGTWVAWTLTASASSRVEMITVEFNCQGIRERQKAKTFKRVKCTTGTFVDVTLTTPYSDMYYAHMETWVEDDMASPVVVLGKVLDQCEWPASCPGTPERMLMHDFMYMKKGQGHENPSRLQLYYVQSSGTNIPVCVFSTLHEGQMVESDMHGKWKAIYNQGNQRVERIELFEVSFNNAQGNRAAMEDKTFNRVNHTTGAFVQEAATPDDRSYAHMTPWVQE
jgi:hypothetical protein